MWTLEELLKIGEESSDEVMQGFKVATPDSVILNCYTSGTTGMPKGVLKT